MYAFIRTLLLSIFWLSTLIVVPYAFFSYLCYAGLCGGDLDAIIHTKRYFVTLYGVYIWLYPLIGFVAMKYSKKLHNPLIALLVLMIPFLNGIPLAYVYSQERLIKQEVSASREASFQAHPTDFICSPNTFVRVDTGTHSMTVFDTSYNQYGTAHNTAYFNSTADLIGHLLRKNIDIAHCKNAHNVFLSDIFEH